MSRDTLIVIDCQNDFIDGALGTPEAQAAVPKIVERIKNATSEQVFYTMDTHSFSYLGTREGIRLPVEHWRTEARLINAE